MTRVLVVVEGGVIQNVMADGPVKVITIDYDTEGVDPIDLHDIPQTDGRFERAFKNVWDKPEYMAPAEMDAIENAKASA